MADAETLAAGPPAAGTLSLDTAYLSNNFASLAGTNTAIQASQTGYYSYSAYSYSPPGGTVDVPGLNESSINGNGNENQTGWAGLSNTVKYVIYAAAGVVALLILGLVIWLCIRRSKKRKGQQARQNARLTTRSSFASPMHERETMNPQSGNAYNYNSNPHASMDEYKEPPSGIFRTQTNYTNSSMDEKNRYGADVQSVHSIPPVYAQQGYSRSIHTSPGDLSGATLFPGQNESEDDTHNIDNNHDNHAGNNAPVHQMLANINTSLSSFKPVPPPGSRSAAPPRVEEPSYPPRMQSHGAMTTSNGQDRSQRYKGDSQQQQQRQQQYYAQDQYQPRQRTYSRNEPSQQQQRQPNAYSSRNGPTSPSYSDGTSIASGRSRNGGSTVTKPVVQDYFSSPEGSANRNNAAAAAAVTAGREPLSPTYQSRYRMPPQNRNRAMSPPLPAAAAVAPASHQQTYHNPCAAFAEDNNGNYNSYNAYTDQYPAGRGNNYDQQQQQQRQRQYEQAYQSRQQQQQYQEEYSPPYNSYRQY